LNLWELGCKDGWWIELAGVVFIGWPWY